MYRPVSALALAHLALLALMLTGADAGRQCSLEERKGLELVKVGGSGRILLETSGVRRKEDCFTACCHASTAGCNAASYVVRGRVGVCQLIKCQPFNSCVWRPSPLSVVIRIQGIKNNVPGPAVSIALTSSGGQAKKTPAKNSPPKTAPKNGKTGVKKGQKGKPVSTANKKPVTVKGKPQPRGNDKVNVNKKTGDKKGPVNKDQAKKSKGIFEYLKDFLTGKKEPKQAEKSSNKAKSSKAGNGITKTNEEQKPGTAAGKTKQGSLTSNKKEGGTGPAKVQGKPHSGNKPGKKMSSAERKKLLEAEIIRRKQLKKKQNEQQLAKQKQQQLAKQKQQQLAKQRAKTAAAKKQLKTKQASSAPPNPKAKESKPADDGFNILPAAAAKPPSKPAGKANNVSGHKVGVNNNIKKVGPANPQNPPNQSSTNNRWKQQQLWKQEQLKRQQARKKARAELTKASLTSLLIGACAAAVMALLVIVAVCRKVWGDDVARYRPLRNYDPKGHNDQTQMLLGSGQKITLNSI